MLCYHDCTNKAVIYCKTKVVSQIELLYAIFV